ncbi:MAG: sugar phosphate isomerase/epimerase [Lachnospiraceae bacterium]|nr:sugar phosphate isomerase/epimerase [Lachnospiraceae bacterium]
MKLAISNIAWAVEQDEQMYGLMKEIGYEGLEIAPTRIFPQNPYENLKAALKWQQELEKKYGFKVPSMQSIWFGRQEKIFGSEQEREILSTYTKKAIDFAATIGCKNLVFGCPRNRVVPEGMSKEFALPFFKELSMYAAEKGTVIGMEANPPIYNTNYINDTKEALELLKQVEVPGFGLNLDVGTMICNHEAVEILEGYVEGISHVHISEPGLKPLEKRGLHKELAAFLKENAYSGFVSIEMGKQEVFEKTALEEIMCYVKEIFG